ncbi:hypothetical protein [Spirilliplanes yamanashiensis]|uniref:Uncharacterized protein n=1 Tax=Spirilliplanes yamanashiensis TaxID=42233 RepID=A0A8J4DJ81_9ACTN|nr:hypothetical protein [Spirilliplanes yamanashiensis]MDP9815643.1 hypothetical protein [Spirilliplanes yamanashiensis]GIJ03897.1 hypothetical protein Sya03_32490 [Spirilliplanes yamanashiensis]
MDRRRRALPEPDLSALFAVLQCVSGALQRDQLPDRMHAFLARRLATDQLLPPGASKGEVNALLADLARRMHWAMGLGDAYPDPGPRAVVHDAVLPGEGAARAFLAEATTLGGRDGRARPGRDAFTVGPDGAPAPAGPADTWLVAVTFTELPPDPAFRDREEELAALAERHGGYYTGHHS